MSLRRLAPSSRRAVGAWPAVLLLLAMLGCALERPEAPEFETTLALPLGTRSVTGQDLLEDSEYIEGDSTGASPLNFVVRGEVDTVEAGTFLDLDTPETEFEVALGEVRLNPPDLLWVAFPLRSLASQFGSLPSDSLRMVVDPFVLDPQVGELAPIEGLEWARLSDGIVRIFIRNELPVPLGADSGEEAIRIRLTNVADGSVVFAAELNDAIAPGDSQTFEGDLAGRVITKELAFELRGGSPGSGGVPVEVRADEQRVFLSALTLGLVADSARAEVPEQSVGLADSVALADDVALHEGEVRDGIIPVILESRLPVAASAHLELPDVWVADREWYSMDLSLPAAAPGRSSRVTADLDLAGTVIRAPGGVPLRALPWRLSVSTAASEGVVTLGARQGARGTLGRGDLAFERITGTMEQRRFHLVPTEAWIDPPEGLDELSFERAAIELLIESSVGIGSVADLVLTGVPEGSGTPVALPLRFAIEPAPAPGETRTTIVRLDETNSAVLELIAARPRRLRIEGNLRVGENGVVGTILRTDTVRGSYLVSAPLRMRIGTIEHRTEPFLVTFDAEAQERIRENVLWGEATGVVRNHFPLGLTARMVFGVTEANLDLDPAEYPDSVCALDPIEVAPGVVDAASGRVTETVESRVSLTIDPARVQFFSREKLFGRIALSAGGGDSSRVVEVTAADYVEFNAMLRFAVRVKR